MDVAILVGNGASGSLSSSVCVWLPLPLWIRSHQKGKEKERRHSCFLSYSA